MARIAAPGRRHSTRNGDGRTVHLRPGAALAPIWFLPARHGPCRILALPIQCIRLSPRPLDAYDFSSMVQVPLPKCKAILMGVVPLVAIPLFPCPWHKSRAIGEEIGNLWMNFALSRQVEPRPELSLLELDSKAISEGPMTPAPTPREAPELSH